MGISERRREIKRRRQRRKKIAKLSQRLHTANKRSNAAERAVVAHKVRLLTPGADVIIKKWDLEDV